MSSTPPPPSSSIDVPDASTPLSPSRPQLHIDTNTPTPLITNTPVTPPRSREGRTSFQNEYNPPPSGSPSIRSQRSDVPRVRFSSDVQTLGDRATVSPNITADEALARLTHSSSMSSLNRRAGTIPSEVPHLPSPQQEQIRGILRAPSLTAGQTFVAGAQSPRRPARPRGWSLRRQLFSKQDPPTTSDITLSSLSTDVVEPRASRTIDDVDAIRVVNAALDQARLDPPITPIHAKSRKPLSIQPEVTQAQLPFYSTWASSHRTRHLLFEKCKDVMRRIKRLRDPRLISKGKGREIPIDIPERGKTNLLDERTGKEYVDNLITSSRYTVYSFLPRQLWAQFSKVANLYVSFLTILMEVIFWSWR
jgi:phospholipid-translocating ATPase